MKKIVIVLTLVVALFGCGSNSSEKKDIETVVRVVEKLVEDGWTSHEDDQSFSTMVALTEHAGVRLSKDTKYLTVQYFPANGAYFLVRYYWLEEKMEFETIGADNPVKCTITESETSCDTENENVKKQLPGMYEGTKQYFDSFLKLYELKIEDVSLPYDYLNTYNSQKDQ